MSETTNLHWSFSHDGEAQSPQFGRQLRSLVKGALESTGESTVAGSGPPVDQVTGYTILPNFRRGYKPRSSDTEDGDDLAVGEVTITRVPNGQNCLNYSVVYKNVASGEILDMKFASNTDAFRTLTGKWSVQVENFSGDGYKGFACDGRLEENGTVILTTNGWDLRAGSADLTVPLTCNWTLFDVIPALAKGLRESGESQRLTILEDLEKVRSNGRIRFLESYDLQLDDELVTLRGYALIAEGMTPTYWWLDSNERVLIASTLYQTIIPTGGKDA